MFSKYKINISYPHKIDKNIYTPLKLAFYIISITLSIKTANR